MPPSPSTRPDPPESHDSLDSPSKPRGKAPWLPQFGLGEMMLTMIIFSVMGAAGSYLVTALKPGQQRGPARAVFAIFTLVAPIALVLVLSTYRSIQQRYFRHNKKNRADSSPWQRNVNDR